MYRFCLTAVVASLFALASIGCDKTDDPATDVVTGTDTTTKADGTSSMAFPAVTLKDCDGNDVELTDRIAAYEVTYLSFAAGWCTACQEEAPTINKEIVDGLAGEPVTTIQILLENQPNQAPPVSLCADWRDQLQAKFEVLVDTSQTMVAQHFNGAVGTLPRHMIVTKDGVVRVDIIGAIPSDLATQMRDWLP